MCVVFIFLIRHFCETLSYCNQMTKQPGIWMTNLLLSYNSQIWADTETKATLYENCKNILNASTSNESVPGRKFAESCLLWSKFRPRKWADIISPSHHQMLFWEPGAMTYLSDHKCMFAKNKHTKNTSFHSETQAPPHTHTTTTHIHALFLTLCLSFTQLLKIYLKHKLKIYTAYS